MFLHAMQYALELQEHMNVYMVMQETNEGKSRARCTKSRAWETATSLKIDKSKTLKRCF